MVTMLFSVGDYLAGMLVGAATALGVRMVVWPGMDMVIAMIIGMGLGTVIHLVLGFLLGPLIGMFEAMIPASLIGMYGGMFFGMRDSMAAGSRTLGAALIVGAAFGAIVVAGVQYYDRALHGPVVDAGD
jgi:large-conductance mechanosensitive channel